jgi:hypothetical protein
MTGQFSVNFGAPAELRKWPSLGNQRRPDREAYLITAGPLDHCIREFMAKPEPTRHLYEIHTARQPPLIIGVLSAEHIAELARLNDFLLKI